MERNGDKVDKLLHTLIENGKGIELNVADLVPGGREDPLLMSFPSVDVLRRYRELGGDIITVGSDAHNAKAAGIGVREGYEAAARLRLQVYGHLPAPQAGIQENRTLRRHFK